MRTAVFALLLAMLAASAQAQSLQLSGKFGYLSEFEVSARLAASTPGAKELSGPMTVTHVGLCTHNGPQQQQGLIKLQMAGPRAPVKATLVFDGRECSYRGPLSQTAIGEMDCPGIAALPFSLWAQ
jgi:hypothetical protein